MIENIQAIIAYLPPARMRARGRARAHELVGQSLIYVVKTTKLVAFIPFIYPCQGIAIQKLIKL